MAVVVVVVRLVVRVVLLVVVVLVLSDGGRFTPSFKSNIRPGAAALLGRITRSAGERVRRGGCASPQKKGRGSDEEVGHRH